ncbi:hypothetical protein KBB12_03935, partial [Candidatus Woesebacteria bacterium]|nr:hypothetical protein [Candidatus Woesebacteria bacterium]
MILSSLLSRFIPRKAKANRFFGLILRESSATGYAYEQTDTNIEILKSKSFSYSKNFDKVLDDTDEIIYECETELKVQFDKVVFVLPVCGLKDDGKEVIQPYRSVISEIVHNLELEAMGYIEMSDVLKESLRQHDSAVYIEVGKFKTQIVFTKEGEKWNQLSINTNPANVVTHLSEFITKGTDIYVYSLHEGVNINALQVALADYTVHVSTIDEIGVGLQKLLKKQLLAQSEEGVSSQETLENTEQAVIDTPPTTPTITPPVIAAPPGSKAGFKIVASTNSSLDDGYVHQPPSIPPTTSPFIAQTEGAQYSEPPATPELHEQASEPISHEVDESEINDEVLVEDDAAPNTSKKKVLMKSIAMSVGIISCIALAGLIVF